MNNGHTAEPRFSSSESTELRLGVITDMLADEVMADFPVLTKASQKSGYVGLCPIYSSDVEGSQPPATTPEMNESLVGPLLLSSPSPPYKKTTKEHTTKRQNFFCCFILNLSEKR